MISLIEKFGKLFELPSGLVLTAVTAVIAIRFFIKQFDKSHITKRKRIEDMFPLLEKREKPIEKFQIEQVIQNRFGFLIEFPVIELFLNQHTPSWFFQNYIWGRDYLYYCPESKKIKLSGSISTEKKYRIHLFIRKSSSLLFAVLSLIMFLLIPDLLPAKISPVTKVQWVIFMLMFGYFSTLFAFSAKKVEKAKEIHSKLRYDSLPNIQIQ